jgi:hypothetical protein
MTTLLNTLAGDLNVWMQTNGPIDCSRHDIAHSIHWPIWQLDRVLAYVRTPDFMAINKWTVPNQPLGRRPKLWRLSDTHQHLLNPARQEARSHQVGLILSLERRAESLRGQTAIFQAEVGTSTSAGKAARAAMVHFEAAVLSLDQVANLL